MKKGKGKNIIIALIVIIIVALIVLFASYTISFHSKAENDNYAEAIDNNDASKTVKEVMDTYYQNIFYGHSYPYCGEIDYNDTIIEEQYKQYNASKTYGNKDELKDYLSTLLSNNFMEKVMDDENYIEQENKLYCYRPGKGTFIYDESNSSYEVVRIEEDKITGIGTISYSSDGGDISTLTANFTLIKENDYWVLDDYQEEL